MALTFAAWLVAGSVPSTVRVLPARHGRGQCEQVTIRDRSGLGIRALANAALRAHLAAVLFAAACFAQRSAIAAQCFHTVLTCTSALWSQSYERRDAEYWGVVERDSDGQPYGCTDNEYISNPEDCTAGGWGFIVVGIIGIFYSIAVLHTAIFGCLTWLKRLEAPPATHGLGPKPSTTAVRTYTLSTLITHGGFATVV